MLNAMAGIWWNGCFSSIRSSLTCTPPAPTLRPLPASETFSVRNTGLLFPGPKGWNCFSTRKNFGVIWLNSSLASMSITGVSISFVIFSPT